MKGRFEVITSENPKEVKIFWDYAKIPDNIIEIILFKPSELDDEGMPLAKKEALELDSSAAGAHKKLGLIATGQQ